MIICHCRPYAEKAKWKDVEQPVSWMHDLFAKYVPPTIFEMKKSYSPVTPLNAMNYVTTLVNILEGCLKPDNLNNKADQPMFEMMFAFAMIWAFGGALCEKDGISYRYAADACHCACMLACSTTVAIFHCCCRPTVAVSPHVTRFVSSIIAYS